MPEGDNVYLTAQNLNTVLAGRVLVRCDIRVPAYATVDLAGERVDKVISRGKHLLTRVGDHTIHTHLKMDGSWHIYRPGARWRRPEWQARIILANTEWEAVGFQLGIVEVLPRHAEDTVIGHLGPDLLGPDWDAGLALQRLLAHPDAPVGAALLDQSIMAGLGNVYRNELCFLRGVLQNLGAWYLRAFNPDVPGPTNILTRRTFGVELFSLELKQKGSYGELSGASWLSMPTGTIGGSPQAQKALTKFAEYACERVERALYVAVRTVLGKDPATAATSDFAFARFSTLADEVITEVIARAVAGEMFTAEQVHAWSRAAVTAFDDAVEPYVNARRLPDIAQARRTLFQAINRTERE